MRVHNLDFTQAIYQTRNEQYFETLKFMKKKPSDTKPTHK